MTFMFGLFEALEPSNVLNGFEDGQSNLPKPILLDEVLSLIGHCLSLAVLWTDLSVWYLDVLLSCWYGFVLWSSMDLYLTLWFVVRVLRTYVCTRRSSFEIEHSFCIYMACISIVNIICYWQKKGHQNSREKNSRENDNKFEP